MTKAYENGMTTRKLILDASKKLFYEKGYHETSYEDICKVAHVNRGSIYYHFKEKENIRYEVLWELTWKCYDLAKEYCDQEKYQYLVGAYILWGLTLHDSKLRKFELDYCADYPVYTSNNPVALYYKMCNKNMYKDIWDLSQVDPLAFATGYGTIYGGLRLIDADPERYSLMEIYRHMIMTGILVWGIPKPEADAMWEELSVYLKKINEKELIEQERIPRA